MTTETKYTPQTAQHFNRYSAMNVSTIKTKLECGCEPYKDVFTYARWQALGYQVKRGEHSIKIPVIIEKENEDGEAIKRLFSSHVFCRCQVKSIKAQTENEPIKPTQPEIKPMAIQPINEPVNSKPESKINDVIMDGWRII
jgi:antirestriction protein ArdC